MLPLALIARLLSATIFATVVNIIDRRDRDLITHHIAVGVVGHTTLAISPQMLARGVSQVFNPRSVQTRSELLSESVLQLVKEPFRNIENGITEAADQP